MTRLIDAHRQYIAPRIGVVGSGGCDLRRTEADGGGSGEGVGGLGGGVESLDLDGGDFNDAAVFSQGLGGASKGVVEALFCEATGIDFAHHQVVGIIAPGAFATVKYVALRHHR
jgi:hypothetical protein